MKNLYIFLHLSKTGGTTFNNHLARELKLDEEFIHPSLIKQTKKKYRVFYKRGNKEKERIRVLSGHGLYYGVHKFFNKRNPNYIIFLRDPAERLESLYNFRVKEMPESRKPSFMEWYKLRRKNELCQYISMFYSGPRLRSKIVHKFLRVNRIIPGNHYRKYFIKKLLSYLGKNPGKNTNKIGALEKSKKLLDLCWFVGITKELDRDLPTLFEKIGVDKNYKNQRITGNKKTWNRDLNMGKSEAKKKFELDNKTKEIIYKENPLDVELYNYAKKLNKEKRKNIKE